jgi:hypothetical protein
MRRSRVFLACLFAIGSPPAPAAISPVKISIKDAGMYAITFAQLSTLGIDTGAIDRDHLTLRHRDQPIAIRIDGDRILFYAQGIAADDPDFPETDLNVYWLEEGADPGVRMALAPVASASTDSPWTTTAHVEIDRIYDAGRDFPDNVTQRLFMAGPLHANEEATIHFKPSQNVAQPIKIVATLQGKTDDPSVNPDHRTLLRLNNCTLGQGQSWDGMSRFQQVETVPAGCLLDGDNTLTLKSLGGTGAAVDSVYLDSVDVSYIQTTKAKGDQLVFVGDPPVTLGGFLNANIDVYSITDPNKPRFVTGATIAASDGAYSVSFEDSGQRERYFVLSSPAYRKLDLKYLEVRRPFPVLKTPDHQVDYIMISHPDLIPALLPLADWRRRQGLRVEVVDVTEIYDEFNGGIVSAQAIKDFLDYAYHDWNSSGPPPGYVLLAGTATVTSKSEFPGGWPTYVPTHFQRAFDGAMIPSDSWFVAVDGSDDLPDMFIGRLPVTPATIAGVISKIISYDRPGTGDTAWRNRTLFIADDDPTDPDMTAAFQTASASMAAILRPQYSTGLYYLGRDNAIGDPATVINGDIIDGNVVTTYTGHGTSSQWSIDALVTSDEAYALGNLDKLTFVVALNCLNGYFILPTRAHNKLSLASAFVTAPRGGAIAVWAATYLGFTADHRVMGEQLFTAIKQQGSQRLGAVTTGARIRALSLGANPDTIDSYVYFGDPATVIASRTTAGSNGGGSGGGGGAMDDWSLIVLLSIARLRLRRRTNSQY